MVKIQNLEALFVTCLGDQVKPNQWLKKRPPAVEQMVFKWPNMKTVLTSCLSLPSRVSGVSVLVKCSSIRP